MVLHIAPVGLATPPGRRWWRCQPCRSAGLPAKKPKLDKTPSALSELSWIPNAAKSKILEPYEKVFVSLHFLLNKIHGNKTESRSSLLRFARGNPDAEHNRTELLEKVKDALEAYPGKLLSSLSKLSKLQK